MNQTRTFLLFAWLLVGFLLWEAWQNDYHRAPPPVPEATEVDAVDVPAPPVDDPTLPAPLAAPGEPPLETSAAEPVRAEPVVVTTDVLRLTIDPRGASPVRAELLAYPQSTDAGAPAVELFSTASGRYFTAQSGWVGNAGVAPTHQNAFMADAAEYTLAAGEDRLEVPFRWTDATGITLTRTLVFERGSYVVTQRETIDNGSAEAWRASPYRQLLRQPPPSAGGGFTNPEAYSYVGAAWYSPAEKFNKVAFDDFDPRQPLDVAGQGGWIAMLQHYFFAAWIPTDAEAARFSTAEINGRYLIRAVSPAIEVAPGTRAEVESRLYVGPKLQDQLAGLAPGLERTIDYGILTLLAEPLFWLLSLFHDISGNWGWAIILLVLLIKAVFFKLSEAQYKSFARMRAVQPRIEALKERYGDDRQKFNMAMMELYKKEKINPMGGCLPILVQIPVFISLYWVLLESVELRHAPWMGWIQNLSAPDPYFVLPVLNLLTMWLTQKLSPAPGMDPLQKKMMQAMPIVFGVLFAFFPAGLVLYWTINGALGLLQQWVITRRHGGPAKV
jgi:YidC/Oxa1 family membrane protein insertase